MLKNKLSPSILSADFLRLGKPIKVLDDYEVPYLHIDIMDGEFVPEISFANPIMAAIRPVTNMYFDVHLMLKNPKKQVESYVRDGANLITIHIEAEDDIEDTLDYIHSFGINAGISIKPGTKACEIIPYIDKVELILIMSVEPGFGGQGFIEESIEKIKEVKKLVCDYKREIDIEVDGGIKEDNVERVLDAGANVIVVGSGIFKGSVEENTKFFMERLENHETRNSRTS